MDGELFPEPQKAKGQKSREIEDRQQECVPAGGFFGYSMAFAYQHISCVCRTVLVAAVCRYQYALSFKVRIPVA